MATRRKDYDIRVENLGTGAGVRQTGNGPMAKLMFCSIRNTVCLDAHVEMSIKPGRNRLGASTTNFTRLDDEKAVFSGGIGRGCDSRRDANP